MGLRLTTFPQLTNVAAKRPDRDSAETIDERSPGPRQVGSRAVLALRLDQLPTNIGCESCREGF